MTDEPKKQPDDIQGILSDLDAILSGLDDTAAAPPLVSELSKLVDAPKPAEPPKPAAAKPAEPPKPAAAKPVEPPKAVEPSKPAEPPKPAAAPKPVEPPKPAEAPKPAPAAPVPEMKVELASREGSLTPPKKTEPPEPARHLASDAHPPLELGAGGEKSVPSSPAAPAPAPVPKAAEPAKPAAAPAPAPKAAEPAKPAAEAVLDDIPPGTPKDQIRRIAYVYTFACLEARAGFAAYLGQAARTISKKPLFIRQVMAVEVSSSSDPNAVFEKARDAKAVAVLAVVDGWPPAKIDGLSEACSRGGMLFRAVAPGDVQKKSTAVDVIVDMMLLSGEA